MSTFIHPTAIVEDGAVIGAGTKIWHFVHVRRGARIGDNCVFGKNVYIDADVSVGSAVKIQNNVSVYHGVEVGDGVFLGPHVCFTNDLNPRAVNPDMTLRSESDWVLASTKLNRGVSVGANSVIVAGITIGEWALIGAGSVVTRTVPAYALVYGNPGRIRGVVAPTGEIVSKKYEFGAEYVTADGKVRFRTPDAP
jgi:acetyltransferase-like isoleucine patch superfamily enzyme